MHSYNFLYSLLIIGILIPLHSSAQETIDTISPPLVKVETCWNYSIENNQATSKKIKILETHFDTKGYKTKSISYKPNGSVAYQYSSKWEGNKLETFWLSKGTGKTIKSQVDEFSTAGQLLKTTRYAIDGSLLDYTVFEYTNKVKSLEVYYNNKNEKVYSIAYSHNPAQKSIRENYTDHLEQDNMIAAVSLDENALPLAYTQYKNSGPLVQNILFKRNSSGQILSKEYLDANNKLKVKEIYKYTDNSMQCSTFAEGGTKLVEQVVFTYEYY